jgi:putative endonuclease
LTGTLPDRVARRRAAYRRGHRAEWLALAALMLKGYWPIGRRVSIAGGEIDLIVRRWSTIAFVEVKARPRREDAREAIDAAKRRRFSRAVRAWIGRNAWCAGIREPFRDRPVVQKPFSQADLKRTLIGAIRAVRT